MSAHTPGPWRAERISAEHGFRAPDREDFYLVGSNGICPGTAWAGVGFEAEGSANARLMAAAPDLLALAHQCASECGDCAGTRVCPDDTPCTACADIWRVIDLAEGRV